MCHLVTDSSVDVQKIAYHLLHKAAKKRTEYLTIEAGVDSDAVVKTELPSELVDILQRSIQDDDEFNRQVRNLLDCEFIHANLTPESIRVHDWMDVTVRFVRRCILKGQVGIHRAAKRTRFGSHQLHAIYPQHIGIVRRHCESFQTRNMGSG